MATGQRCAQVAEQRLSAGLRVDYLDHLKVWHRGRQHELGWLLHYHGPWAARLHARDRVHTYGSFHIADLP